MSLEAALTAADQDCIKLRWFYAVLSLTEHTEPCDLLMRLIEHGLEVRAGAARTVGYQVCAHPSDVRVALCKAKRAIKMGGVPPQRALEAEQVVLCESKNGGQGFFLGTATSTRRRTNRDGQAAAGRILRARGQPLRLPRQRGRRLPCPGTAALSLTYCPRA
jgi:hypothetical protein